MNRSYKAIMNAWKTLIICLLAIIPLAGCGEAYRYEAGIYLAAAQSALIEQGVCSSKNDCNQKNMAFWGGGSSILPSMNKAFISIYQIKDPAIAEMVAKRIARERARIHGPACLLLVYAGPHGDAAGEAKEISI